MDDADSQTYPHKVVKSVLLAIMALGAVASCSQFAGRVFDPVRIASAGRPLSPFTSMLTTDEYRAWCLEHGAALGEIWSEDRNWPQYRDDHIEFISLDSRSGSMNNGPWCTNITFRIANVSANELAIDVSQTILTDAAGNMVATVEAAERDQWRVPVGATELDLKGTLCAVTAKDVATNTPLSLSEATRLSLPVTGILEINFVYWTKIAPDDIRLSLPITAHDNTDIALTIDYIQSKHRRQHKLKVANCVTRRPLTEAVT